MAEEQIDISLSLLGGGGSQALSEFVDAVKKNTVAMADVQRSLSGLSDVTPMRPNATPTMANASVPTSTPSSAASVPSSISRGAVLLPSTPDTSSAPSAPDDAEARSSLSLYEKFKQTRVGQMITPALPFVEGQFYYNKVGALVQSGIAALPIVSPQTAQSMGEAAGLSRTPSFGRVGPFTLPGAQYFSPAGQYGLSQVTSSFMQGLTTPGISGKEIQDIKSNLVQLGYGRNDQFGGITDALINARKQGGAPDVNVMGPMVDQFMRYGDRSVTDLQRALSGLGDAAAASKMNVNEYTQAITEQAKAAEQSGGNFGKATEAIKQFSTTSGLAPEFVGQLTQNRFVQMGLTQKTGLLPWEQGLLQNATGGMDIIQHQSAQTIEQLMGVFQRSAVGRKLPPGITTHDVALADVSNLMGMPTKSLEKILKNAQFYPARRTLAKDLNTFSGEFGNKRGATATFTNDPAFKQVLADAVNARYETKDKTLKDIGKIVHGADSAHPVKVAQDIKQWMNAEASKNSTAGRNQMHISLDAAAARYFDLVGPNGTRKKDANFGGPPMISTGGHNMIVNPRYGR